MAGKPYKSHKRGAGRHVQLPEWLKASEAWATLRPGPRALYVELKRRFNGRNNGHILLSHRDAAKALHVHYNTVGPYFKELQDRGFIRMTQGYHLGASGIGQTSHWALEELPTDDLKSAQKSFMSWREIQNPRTKNGTPRHNNSDTDQLQASKIRRGVLKIVT